MPSTYSRLGLWNKFYETSSGEPRMFGDTRTAELAGEWLNVPYITTVEDWGCGHGGFKKYLGPHQTYVGIDGSKAPHASVIADLTTYRSCVDAIHVRHVLEHNAEWREILANVLSSFTKRAVLTLFTPLVETETVIARHPNFHGTGFEMVDISLPRAELESILAAASLEFVSKKLRTKTQYKIEHMYLLAR